ncbi:MAG TPA: response regulator [Bryobacteraceae bacterium]|jgi:DNA-binding NarL/FixJ family response regulator|nr:response regulator [Bryobacteraceae bacterium]
MKRLRILIADDDEPVRVSLRALLESHNYEVAGEAPHGQAAVEEAARLQPDVVLLDIRMPVMNGFHAARKLKAQQPETKIIFVAARDEVEYVEEAFRCGADAYVVKIAAREELAQAICAVIAGQQFRSRHVAARPE